MADDLVLLPVPKRVDTLGSMFALEPERFVLLEGQVTDHALRAGREVQQAVATAGARWELTASHADEESRLAARILVDPAQAPWNQGYRLSIGPEGIRIVAHDAAGAFYAAMTLKQIARQFAGRGELPCVLVLDWPDFPNRGVMLDICKYKVPTMETLYGLVDMLAEWKVNQLQLYAEHTFAYRSFPEVSHGFSPVTGEEVLALDAYCSERHVELVPNQNSFGHMERWLVHERMQHLAEVPDGAIDPWEKGRKEPFSLCPTDPESLEFLREIYTDLLPHFSSRQFNVGCDETWDVGMGRSKDRCEALGVGRVYLDFLEGIGSIVRSSGHTMQFWADVIQEHPDLIAELPADSVAMEWGYRRDHPFAERCARLAAHGVPTYVCPGTSTWNSVAGQTDEAVANIHRAAEEGLSEGAIGLLNTDWGGGMHGHWQYLPVSYLGMAWGAALSWSVAANAGLDMPRALDAHAFMDRAGVMGRLAFELGNAYRAPGVASRSGSVLGQILICFEPWRWARRSLSLSVEGLRQTLDYIDGVMNDLPAARMDRPDSDLIAMEFRNAAAMLRHACRLGLARLEADGELARAPEADRAELAEDMERIVAEHRRLWLARSRPGGLDASASRLSRWITVYVPSSAQSAPA